MDKNTINKLAYKIGDEANKIFASANNIKLNTSGVSEDPLIIEHNEKFVKISISDIKKNTHKLNEYLEEIESHIYDGEIENG